MNENPEKLLPGMHVEVMTKHQVDGESLCGTILGAAPNTPGAYVVEYHPGLDNGQHNRNELRIIEDLPCSKTA